MTIDKILRIMNYTFKMLVIKVNGELIKKEEYGTKNVPVNSVVKIIHLISGG
ncbi:MAG: sulfur carrier protein ThiS [Candidatus Cloacimonetes bacterium]|nr:sulfur carrier protein ThiS [Candidatus Cloacimonadota bacterium]